MQKITLKFIGTGIEDKYQVCVRIYDNCGHLLCEQNTYNGELTIYLKEFNIYTMTANFYEENIKQSFYVSNTYYKYTFFLKRSLCPITRTITFLLNDANYNNLPIEKGELILWQKT